MAVILQPVVGRRRGQLFYPTFSGVAESYNFYPIGPQQPDDGVVLLALGLGRQVVEGGLCLRVCPRHPGVGAAARHARRECSTARSSASGPSTCGGVTGKCDSGWSRRWGPTNCGSPTATACSPPIASVYSQEENRLVDDLSRSGPRVITFSNLLRHEAIPLAPAIEELLEMARAGMASAVEIELAVEMGDWGRRTASGREREEPCLYVLQMRPFATGLGGKEEVATRFADEELLCRSAQTLGHGVLRDIRDVVFVDRGRWNAAENREIAGEIEGINRASSASRSGRSCSSVRAGGGAPTSGSAYPFSGRRSPTSRCWWRPRRRATRSSRRRGLTSFTTSPPCASAT